MFASIEKYHVAHAPLPITMMAINPVNQLVHPLKKT